MNGQLGFPSPSMPSRRVINQFYSQRMVSTWQGSSALAGWSGQVSGGLAYRELRSKNGDGYVYWQFQDNSIQIRPGSPANVGSSYAAGTTAAKNVMAQFGPYETSGGGFFSTLTTIIGGGDSKNALKNVLNAAQQYGPDAVAAAKQLAANAGQSEAALRKKLASKLAAYQRTTNTSKKLQLAYEIAGIKAQLETQQAVAQMAMTDATGSYVDQPQESQLPSWVLPVGLVTLAVVGGVLVLKR